MSTVHDATPITCKATLYAIGAWTILSLPKEASNKLPARGQAMVKGTFNGVPFHTPLEPDGRLSHWFRVDDDLLKRSRSAIGDTVTLTITPVTSWPEPEVPADLQRALTASAKARALWKRITPMARWEWVRWARATSSAETRARRIKVGISKLESGERRPCCWNRNACTEPQVSKSGVLLEPTPAAR